MYPFGLKKIMMASLIVASLLQGHVKGYIAHYTAKHQGLVLLSF